MRVQDVMSTPVICCRTGDTLEVVVRLMWEADCGSIPVTDTRGKLVGIVTDRDVCMATHSRAKPPQEIPIEAVMSRRVWACRPGDSLKSMKRLMCERQIRRAPVVDDKHRPIGLASLNDIARRAATSSNAEPLARDLVRTLAAVCQPRKS